MSQAEPIFDLRSRAKETEAKLAEMVDWFRKFTAWVPKEAREHDHVLRDGWIGVDRGSLPTNWMKEADVYAATPSEFPFWERMAAWQTRAKEAEAKIEFWLKRGNEQADIIRQLQAKQEAPEAGWAAAGDAVSKWVAADMLSSSRPKGEMWEAARQASEESSILLAVKRTRAMDKVVEAARWTTEYYLTVTEPVDFKRLVEALSALDAIERGGKKMSMGEARRKAINALADATMNYTMASENSPTEQELRLAKMVNELLAALSAAEARAEKAFLAEGYAVTALETTRENLAAAEADIGRLREAFRGIYEQPVASEQVHRIWLIARDVLSSTPAQSVERLRAREKAQNLVERLVRGVQPPYRETWLREELSVWLVDAENFLSALDAIERG